MIRNTFFCKIKYRITIGNIVYSSILNIQSRLWPAIRSEGHTHRTRQVMDSNSLRRPHTQNKAGYGRPAIRCEGHTENKTGYGQKFVAKATHTEQDRLWPAIRSLRGPQTENKTGESIAVDSNS